MVLFNYSTREITAKIVYYGPGLCGKTTNLQYIHENLPNQVRGKMLSLATKTDRTLFFDFLPIDLGEIRGMKTRVQLYTVPGQVFYNETRKLVLKGADGIVFVADSQETMLGANVESYRNLEDNLKGHGMQLADIPHVIQFNKRDLPRLASIEDLNAGINKYNAPFYESVAVTGIGVQDTLKAIVKLVLLNLTRRYDPKAAPVAEERTEAAAPVARRPAAPSPAPIATPPTAAPAAPARAVPAGEPTASPTPMRASSRVATTDAARSIPLSPFSDEEIDGLVDEVEDVYASDGGAVSDRPARMPEAAMADSRPIPSESAVDPDEGAWMGETDDASPAVARTESAFGDPSSDDRADAPLAVTPGADHDAEWRGGLGRGHGDPAPARRESSATMPGTSRASEVSDREVTLTEVVNAAALFDDPNLEVASLDPGEAREIVVPVQLGIGAQSRRFKLSIRLRLDPLD